MMYKLRLKKTNISAIKNDISYQISNNHGHVNGTIIRNSIFGIVVEIL